MARQVCSKIEGTIEDLCFYQMEGAFYVRARSSLTGKRFFMDRAFAASRKSAERFAEGNRLASQAYSVIEKEKKVYRLFCFLKKKAIALLKEGKHKDDVKAILIEYLADFGLGSTEKEFTNHFPATGKNQHQPLFVQRKS